MAGSSNIWRERNSIESPVVFLINAFQCLSSYLGRLSNSNIASSFLYHYEKCMINQATPLQRQSLTTINIHVLSEIRKQGVLEGLLSFEASQCMLQIL